MHKKISVIFSLIFTTSAIAASLPSEVFLNGTFDLSGQNKTVVVGRSGTAGDAATVRGVIADTQTGETLAECTVTRFERFQKDGMPALMEFDCLGAKLHTMKMPLHIQWERLAESNTAKKFDVTIRLGSAIFGMEQAPLQVAINRYNPSPGMNVEAISGIKKKPAKN